MIFAWLCVCISYLFVIEHFTRTWFFLLSCFFLDVHRLYLCMCKCSNVFLESRKLEIPMQCKKKKNKLKMVIFMKIHFIHSTWQDKVSDKWIYWSNIFCCITKIDQNDIFEHEMRMSNNKKHPAQIMTFDNSNVYINRHSWMRQNRFIFLSGSLSHVYTWQRKIRTKRRWAESFVFYGFILMVSYSRKDNLIWILIFLFSHLFNSAMRSLFESFWFR